MPDIRSALSSHLRPGRFGSDAGEPRIALSERPLGTLIQLSGWPDSFEQAATPALQRLGFAGIGNFNRAQVVGCALSFRIAPERVLVRLPSPSPSPSPSAWAEIAPRIDPALTPALDLSHSRTVLRIAGAASAELLARGLPIDLNAAAFPPDNFVQSGIHSIGVLVHRRANENGAPVFEVHVPRSYAVTIWEFLAESAAPFGYRTGEPI